MTRLLRSWRPLYYSLAGFFLLAGLTSGERPFFVLFLAQILLALAALLVNLYAAWTFSFLQQTSTSQVLHGDQVHLQLQIHNEKVLPYPCCGLKSTRQRIPNLPVWNSTWHPTVRGTLTCCSSAPIVPLPSRYGRNRFHRLFQSGSTAF